MQKKVTIAVPNEPELMENIFRVKNYIDISQTHCVLIHYFSISHYMNEFTPYVFPNEGQKVEIKASILKMLENTRNKLGLTEQNSTLLCEFTNSPRADMVDYLKTNKQDMVVVATRGKHGIPGLFDSSFAEYLNKFSPCDILVLRPHSK